MTTEELFTALIYGSLWFRVLGNQMTFDNLWFYKNTSFVAVKRNQIPCFLVVFERNVRVY